VLEASGAMINSIKKSKSSTTAYLINNNRRFSLTWRKKDITVERRVPAKFLASVASLYRPGPKFRQISHIVAVQMQRGRADEFILSFPAACRLIEVVGEGIKAHRTKTEGEHEKLTVSTLEPIEESMVLILRMERRSTGSRLEISPLTVENAERQTGFIAVDPTEPATVSAEESPLFDRIDIRELPPEIGKISPGEPALAFQYRLKKDAKPQSLGLEINYQPTADLLASFIEKGKALSLLTEDGKCITRARYNLVTASEQFLRLNLNKSDTVLSVMVGGKPVPAVHENRDLIIPLKNKTSDRNYEVEVVFLSDFAPFDEDGEKELILPRTNTPLHLFNWEVYLPEDYEYEDFGGNLFEGEPTFKPSIAQLIRQLEKKKISTFGRAVADEEISQVAAVKKEARVKALKEKIEYEKDRLAAPEPPPAKPTTGAEIDLSAATLSLSIDIPRSGVLKKFHTMMLKNDAPELKFSYEEK